MAIFPTAVATTFVAFAWAVSSVVFVVAAAVACAVVLAATAIIAADVPFVVVPPVVVPPPFAAAVADAVFFEIIHVSSVTVSILNALAGQMLGCSI